MPNAQEFRIIEKTCCPTFGGFSFFPYDYFIENNTQKNDSQQTFPTKKYTRKSRAGGGGGLHQS